MNELDNLLEKLVNLEAKAQEMPGPRPEADETFMGEYGKEGHHHDYKMSEETITLAEFLELVDIVMGMLELMGAKR